MALSPLAPAIAGVAEATVIFLLISPGARAGGMGEAFVAVADDATATFWNPAGLAWQNRRELTLMHVNWLPTFRLSDLYYDFVSYVNNVEDWGTFGLNVVFLNLGETERRDELNTDLGTFSTYETAISGSYGATVTDDLALGINTKFIYSHLADRGTGQERGSGTATNFAVDLGVLYKTVDPLLNRNLNLGANLSNLGPKMAYIDRAQADPIPTNLKFGFAWELVNDGYNKLTLAYDMNKLLVRKHPDGTTDPFFIALYTAWTDEPVFIDMTYNVGLEYWYSDLVALRFGYWNDEIGKVKPLTYGASFKVSTYRFDFSYISAGKGHPLTDTMRLSLTIGL
ncbi:MAG: UPF0164 family protein [Calditrichaeota bacterium]|nr:UPF0164 family protein [Calditrichota bacterium]